MSKLWFTERAARVRAALSDAARSWLRCDRYRALGIAGLIGSVALALYVRHDAGITLDEPPQMRYGRRIAAWFVSGFQDRRAIDGDLVLAHYGGLFEALAQLAVHFTPSDPVGTRHAASALCAVLGMIATWKMAERMLDRRAALIAAGMLALTPVWIGHGLFNPKDIPFAAAAAWAAYFTQRIGADRAPSLRLHIACGVALGAALGVRPGGMFLLAYPLIAWVGRALTVEAELASPLSAAGVCLRRLGACWLTAWMCMLAAWPWAQISPLAHPLEAVTFTAQSTWSGTMLFDGTIVQARHLPRDYLPLWFAVTLPETYALALACALACLPGLLRRPLRWTRPQLGAALVLMAATLPVLGAVITRPVLYDAQRHFLFILPPLAAVSGACIARFLLMTSIHPSLRAVALGVLLGLSGVIASDIVRLHPYEYAYFNRMVGGLPGEQSRFETDYWGASYQEGIDWLARQLDPADHSRVRVGTCNHDEALIAYLRNHPELAKRVQLERNADAADIFLATTRYNCHKRDGQVLHVVERMGVPFLYVIQRHPLISNGQAVAHRGD